MELQGLTAHSEHSTKAGELKEELPARLLPWAVSILAPEASNRLLSIVWAALQRQRCQDLLRSSCQKCLPRAERAAASTRSPYPPSSLLRAKGKYLDRKDRLSQLLAGLMRRCRCARRPRRAASTGRSCQGVTHFGIKQVFACEAPQPKVGGSQTVGGKGCLSTSRVTWG